MWIKRVIATKKKITDNGGKFEGNLAIRALISATFDSDSNSVMYIIVSFSAVSFLFLGGTQLDYQTTVAIMILYYAVTSFGESLWVYLAYRDATCLQDVVHTSAVMQSSLRNVTQSSLRNPSVELKPTNVYEDLGRGRAIVIIIFITQCVLVSFVVSTSKCSLFREPIFFHFH
jgi:hypothetical protein